MIVIVFFQEVAFAVKDGLRLDFWFIGMKSDS